MYIAGSGLLPMPFRTSIENALGRPAITLADIDKWVHPFHCGIWGYGPCCGWACAGAYIITLADTDKWVTGGPGVTWFRACCRGERVVLTLSRAVLGLMAAGTLADIE